MQQHTISVARKQPASDCLPFSGNEMEFIRLRLLTPPETKRRIWGLLFFYRLVRNRKRKKPQSRGMRIESKTLTCYVVGSERGRRDPIKPFTTSVLGIAEPKREGD